MRKTVAIMLFAALPLLPARAADPELALETKRMLAYGTLAVMTGACGTVVSGEQAERLRTGLAQSSEAQDQLSEAEFTEAMKAVGARVGQNRAQVCAALTPDFIESSLNDAAAGR